MVEVNYSYLAWCFLYANEAKCKIWRRKNSPVEILQQVHLFSVARAIFLSVSLDLNSTPEMPYWPSNDHWEILYEFLLCDFIGMEFSAQITGVSLRWMNRTFSHVSAIVTGAPKQFENWVFIDAKWPHCYETHTLAALTLLYSARLLVFDACQRKSQ